MTIRFLLLVTFLLFIGNSCSRKSTALSDPTTFNPYLASYTGSIISRVSPIVVTFTAPYGQDADAIKAPAAILEFAPAIQGKLEWRDPYSIQFTPEGPLPSGQDYMATLQLSKIVSGLPDSLQQFVFGFKTRDQFMRISLDDLTIPDESKPSSYQVSGKVLCSDFAEEKAIEKAITVQLPGTPPAISWNHDPGGMIHHFTLYPVVAGPTAESLTINWNGSSLGLENDGSEKIDIPSATDFRILRANVQQGNQSGLRISFSQLLDKDQDLTGLVYLSTLPEVIPQFIIEGNNLTCYFPSKLVGNHDLQISKGVKNRLGKSLNQPFTQKINFTQAQPGVRLVGSGNIMPHADQLYFPFEAMNLHTVDVEIFKIHKTNILQFLQVNQLDGDYETQRVGKIIWRGQVDLSSLNPERNNLEYVRYALDLAPLIEPDPEAIYQVRIGFWKEYSDFVCDETNTPLPNDSDDDEGEGYYEEESNPDEYSIMQAYYGREGYTPNFRWELRDDPCATEYYNSDRFVSRNVLSSNLGITCKQSESGDILIVATDLRTAKPVANAHVSFYDYQLQVIQTGKTNNQGIYLAKTRKSPEFVVVRLDQQTGYLVLKDYNTLTTSDFQTEGTAVKKGLRGFTYAERGVWRPGDSIFLNLVLYDPQKSLPVSYPITMEFIDPRGREVSKFVNTKPVGPIYPFAIVTSSDAPTGVWHARFKAGGATFSHYLRIETIKPNRYKLLLDFGKDRLRAKDEPFSASLKATWLHGAPAPYQEAQIEARALPIPTLFKGYESFIFDHPDRDFENQEFVWIKEKTNQDGILQIRNKPLLGKVNPPGKLKINLKYRVNEPGGGFSQDFRSIDYDPYASYCGISIPTNKDGEPVFDSNEKVTIRFASVSEDGKPNARKTLQVRLVRKEWRWWWERYRDNRTGYNESAFQEEDKSTVLTTNAKGIAEWSLQFDKYSRYFVEVCDAESGHCSGADIYIWSNAAGGSKDVKYFTFTTDKEEYKPGETVTVELPGAADGQALISLESGSNILSAQLISLGKNKSLHKFQVTPEMTPNIYIHIALLQPHSQLANDLPLRLYGIHPIKISDPTSKLDLIVNAPVEMRPDKAYTLQVSEKNSQPMAYTIALVDEGLLDLTRFKTPNPHEKLFSKEALGVKSWDMYDQVLGGFAGELKRIVSIGGDAAAARPDGNPKANRFKPAVVHLGPFKLAAGKKASHQITIPNYVGSVRLMVVAANDKAFGSKDQTIPVRKPLMVAATLPRQLGIKESLDLAVTVFAMDPKVKQASLSMKETSGLVRFTEGSSKTVSFSKMGEQTFYFPIVAGNGSGTAKFEIDVSGGGESAKQKIEIAIRNPNPIQTVTYEQLLKPGQNYTFSAPLAGTPGTNKAVLNAMSVPPVQLESRLNYLMNYPFGCLEQTTSAVFPLLYIHEIMDLPPGAIKDMSKRIEKGVQRILSMKDEKGRLLYWPEGNYHHPWSEIYASQFLVLAKEMGYTIQEAAYKQILNNQKQLANNWQAADKHLRDYGEYTRAIQAYRLYMLAQAGEGQLGAMNRLKERKDLADLDKWLLASAYAKMGKKDVGKSMTANLAKTVSLYKDTRFTFGSDVRDLGLMSMAFQELGDRENAFLILRQLAAKLNSGSWYSTQSVSIGLWAYANFIRKSPSKGNFNMIYTLAKGDRKQIGSTKPLIQIPLTPGDVNQKPLVVENTSQEELFIQLALSGRPDLAQEFAQEKGISLKIRYITIDGNPLEISRLALGTDFIAIAEVQHEGATDETLFEVALHQTFPSGWEIRNLRMDQESVTKLPTMVYKYQDIRDDQINTFFDLKKQRNNQNQVISQLYYIALTASYPGKFYLPAQQAGAMYDPDFSATIPGKWVEVFDPSR